jgi:hypothetical protein
LENAKANTGATGRNKEQARHRIDIKMQGPDV